MVDVPTDMAKILVNLTSLCRKMGQNPEGNELQEVGEEEGNGDNENTQHFQEIWLWSRRERGSPKSGLDCEVERWARLEYVSVLMRKQKDGRQTKMPGQVRKDNLCLICERKKKDKKGYSC